jgi:hypothetical protein
MSALSKAKARLLSLLPVAGEAELDAREKELDAQIADLWKQHKMLGTKIKYRKDRIDDCEDELWESNAT